MKKESSHISVVDLEEGKILKTGFHDEFDALEWAEKNGYLEKVKINGKYDWSKWLKPDGSHACFIDRPELPAEYLEEKCDEALKRFYFRSEKIISIILNSLKSYNEFKRYFGGFKTYIRYLMGKVI